MLKIEMEKLGQGPTPGFEAALLATADNSENLHRGKEETSAPICRKRPRKEFRGQQTNNSSITYGLQG
jgi:hypothetical protein